jgi:diadenosine tetraphosphatase ApaH/serine/threonine PP2A family protein phosphatase
MRPACLDTPAKTTMRLAVFSDIHANPLALQACLDKAEELGATQHALLGDLVGYGPDPSAVVTMVQSLQEQGAWVLRGNHDTLAAAPPAEAKTHDEHGAQWTHNMLDAAQHAYLAGLPLEHQEGRVYLVHASADAPERWRYVTNPVVAGDSLNAAAKRPEVRWVLGGHVHMQALYYRGVGSSLMLFEPTPGVAIPVPAHRHWLATVGSVGQPRDGNRAAAFALLDTDRAQLSFFRVNYDVGAVAIMARRKGLPEDLIKRLQEGR